MKKWLYLSLLFSLPSLYLQAQSSVNQQAWFEYMLNYPFANSFNLENAFTYSTLMGTPKWRAYDYSATLEWSVSNRVDIIGQTVLSYTNQTDAYNTF